MGEWDPNSDRRVKRRAVCYFSGYDPRGARYYHSLFKAESAKQAELAGVEIETGKRKKVSTHVNRWDVCWEGVDEAQTDYFVWSYDDIIKNNWARTDFEIIVDFCKGYWELITSGLAWKGWKINWPTMVTLSYPVVMISLQLLLIATIVGLTQWLSPLAWWLNLLAVIPAVPLALRLGRYCDSKCNHYWIVRTMKFWALQRYRTDENFDSRIAEFSAELSKLDQSGDYDEIIVVGHSLGTVMCTELMAQALRDDSELGTRGAEVNMITLGGTLPFVAYMPKNHGFRSALEEVIHATRIDWLDFAARVDGPSFYMMHPMSTVRGWDGHGALPRLEPARFFKCFTPEGYERIKADRLDLHFQYIMATELNDEYDYFRMVAGTYFLRDRYPKPAKPAAATGS